jgi:hypothetical protein
MRFRTLTFLPSLLLIDDRHDHTAFPVAAVHLERFRLGILDDTAPGSR